MFNHAVDSAEYAGLVKSGELVAITAGVPLGISGTTNMMKVHVVGHILATGRGVTKRKLARGCAYVNPPGRHRPNSATVIFL